MRQGAIVGFCATLGIDEIVGCGELVKEVEGFEAQDKLAFRKGLA